MIENDPCQPQIEELRRAIEEWVRASEATLHFQVSSPWKVDDDTDTFTPEYFRAMKKAYDRELEARERYIQANLALYDCKEQHGER